MATSWYTIVVGILLSLNGIIFLLFPSGSFKQPNWYVGLLILIGVVGIILGIVSVVKQKKPSSEKEKQLPRESDKQEV